MLNSKKIVLILFLSLSIFANENNKTKTALEMFMFKIGITSLTYDLENEKKNIFNNSSEIKALKDDIRYLLEQNIKNKLVIKDDTTLAIEDNKSEDFNKLKIENRKLKRYIKKLESKYKEKTVKKKNISKFKKAFVDVEKVSIKEIPFQNGKILKYLYQNDIVYIDSCNRYGWCKLENNGGYIPKYKLKFMKDNP